jgi:hypothetical protein
MLFFGRLRFIAATYKDPLQLLSVGSGHLAPQLPTGRGRGGLELRAPLQGTSRGRLLHRRAWCCGAPAAKRRLPKNKRRAVVAAGLARLAPCG